MEERGNRNPLLEQVAAKRQQAAREKSDQELMATIIPDFVSQLDSLITQHISPSEITIETRSPLAMSYTLFEGSFVGENPPLTTSLQARIPSTKGSVGVTIFASDYPKQEKKSPMQYQIDVEDLDYGLVIKNSTATIKSRRERDREATPIDIKNYKLLLDSLDNEGVHFEGYTPPNVKYDDSAIREEEKKRNEWGRRIRRVRKLGSHFSHG